MTADKRILVIAGPNSAGKTTFATEFLPNEADCPIFVNADLIAAGLSPFRSSLVAVQAARLMLGQIDEHARKGRSFAFETTLSGRRHARRIPRWQEQGYRVKLFFLRLPTPERRSHASNSACWRAAMTCRSRLFGGDSMQAGATSSTSTAIWSMPGPCTTIQATFRCWSRRRFEHEHPTPECGAIRT